MNKTEEKEQKVILSDAYGSFQKGMSQYSFFKIHAHPLSDDLVQDAFIKTWSYLAKGGKILLMKSFLYHILNDLIIDEYRKKKPSSLDEMVENGFEPKDKEQNRNTDIFDGNIAMLLIDKLPAKYQKIMKMKYVQNLSISEMSLLTGQSKNTIAVQIHRGTEMLKVLYNH